MAERTGQVVFYASDSGLAIEGMKMLFAEQDKHVVVYTAEDLGSLENTLSGNLDPEPTVLLMDPAFPTHEVGHKAASKFKEKFPKAKVVTISLSSTSVDFGDRNLMAPVARESLFETLANLES